MIRRRLSLTLPLVVEARCDLSPQSGHALSFGHLKACSPALLHPLAPFYHHLQLYILKNDYEQYCAAGSFFAAPALDEKKIIASPRKQSFNNICLRLHIAFPIVEMFHTKLLLESCTMLVR
jgi:hypothetical protein